MHVHLHRHHKLIVVLLAAALAGCTVPLGSWSSHLAGAPDDGSALDAQPTRCAALGGKAAADTDCQSAWDEARRRIPPVPPEK